MGIRKSDQRAMIQERRLEVARLYYRGNKSGKDIATVIIPKWHVDLRTVQMDLKYIRDHEPEILRDYMVKTVPHVLNKALSRLDQANSEAWAIIEKSDCSDKEKIAAVGVIGKIAKDMVDIITNNKSVIDQTGITAAAVVAATRTTTTTLIQDGEEKRKEDNNNNNELSEKKLLSQQPQTIHKQYFDKLRDLPFWISFKQDHAIEYKRSKRNIRHELYWCGQQQCH